MDFRECLNDIVFCCEREDGEGFVELSKCQCHLEGELSCDGYKEKTYFHSLFKGKTTEEVVKIRFDIIKELEVEYDWESTKWLKNNVKK